MSLVMFQEPSVWRLWSRGREASSGMVGGGKCSGAAPVSQTPGWRGSATGACWRTGSTGRSATAARTSAMLQSVWGQRPWPWSWPSVRSWTLMYCCNTEIIITIERRATLKHYLFRQKLLIFLWASSKLEASWCPIFSWSSSKIILIWSMLEILSGW